MTCYGGAILSINKFMFYIVSSVLASGCATGLSKSGIPINYNDVSWVVKPVEISFAEQERSVDVNELLFEQPLVSAKIAILSKHSEIPVIAATVFSGSPGSIAYAAGSRLYQLEGVMPEHAAYCDFNSWKSQNIRDGRHLRPCLVDIDRDQQFDYSMWIPVSDNFSMPLTLSIPDNTINVPYTVQADSTLSLMSLGIVVTKGILGAYRAEYAVPAESSPIILRNEKGLRATRTRATKESETDAEAVFFRSEDLPLTLNIRGAKIRVESVVDDIVTYRLLSGFDVEQDLSIAYSGVLPREN